MRHDITTIVGAKFGISDNALKALIVLDSEVQRTPEEASDATGIPRTKTYPTLIELVDKGFATCVTISTGTTPLAHARIAFRLSLSLSVGFIEETILEIDRQIRELQEVRKKIRESPHAGHDESDFPNTW